MHPLMCLPFIRTALFVRRLSRVSALIKINNSIERAHLTNTGRLPDILIPGNQLIIYPIKGMSISWRILGNTISPQWATVIDTFLQEKITEIIIRNGLIDGIPPAHSIKTHPRLGNYALDMSFTAGNQNYFLEIKSAVLYDATDNSGQYPDTITTRGQKHISEISKLRGIRVILFVIGHPYPDKFRPATYDPTIHPLLKKAQKQGFIIKAIKIAFNIPERTIYLLSSNVRVCL